MRKPVHLAILGISIVVAAGSLGVTLARYLSLRAYAPKAGRAHRRRSPGAVRSDDDAGAVDQPLRPRAGDEIAVAAPRGEREIRFPGAAHGVRPRGDHRLLQSFRPPCDPVGERDEGAEGVP